MSDLGTPTVTLQDTGTATQFAIYEHPPQYPHHWVVVAWTPGPGHSRHHQPLVLADSLKAARESIPPGRARQGRSHDDDPSIVEVWC